MPQLLHLDGRPQTWDELHARLENYYSTRLCGWCREGLHGNCSGWLRLPEGATRLAMPCMCGRCWE